MRRIWDGDEEGLLEFGADGEIWIVDGPEADVMSDWMREQCPVCQEADHEARSHLDQWVRSTGLG